MLGERLEAFRRAEQLLAELAAGRTSIFDRINESTQASKSGATESDMDAFCDCLRSRRWRCQIV
jgi:hypothetical protein